jgi:hypothetical protein
LKLGQLNVGRGRKTGQLLTQLRIPKTTPEILERMEHLRDELHKAKHHEPLRVLEIGNFVSVAYAGMVLAEQGAEVQKWTNGRDPILGCRSGDALWEWIDYGKTPGLARTLGYFGDLGS